MEFQDIEKFTGEIMNREMKVYHKIYGYGLIVDDVENLCNYSEVLVKFDNSFYVGAINNHKSAFLQKQNIEIINKNELETTSYF